MVCPVCNAKIHPLDLRQNCKHCGTNLFLHNFNERLEQDSIQAEKDYQQWLSFTGKFSKMWKDFTGKFKKKNEV